MTSGGAVYSEIVSNKSGSSDDRKLRSLRSSVVAKKAKGQGLCSQVRATDKAYRVCYLLAL